MKLTILASALIIGLNSIGQNINSKVIEYLGAEKAKELFSNNAEKYNHLLDFIDNSWYVQDVSFKDLSDLKDFRTVNFKGTGANLFDDGENFLIEKFNPLLYDIKIQDKYPTTYKLGETGKIIVFYSREYFIEKAKETK
jgi:hypothetical protein